MAPGTALVGRKASPNLGAPHFSGSLIQVDLARRSAAQINLKASGHHALM
jgi:hypothetical protein